MLRKHTLLYFHVNIWAHCRVYAQSHICNVTHIFRVDLTCQLWACDICGVDCEDRWTQRRVTSRGICSVTVAHRLMDLFENYDIHPSSLTLISRPPKRIPSWCNCLSLQKRVLCKSFLCELYIQHYLSFHENCVSTQLDSLYTIFYLIIFATLKKSTQFCSEDCVNTACVVRKCVQFYWHRAGKWTNCYKIDNCRFWLKLKHITLKK